MDAGCHQGGWPQMSIVFRAPSSARDVLLPVMTQMAHTVLALKLFSILMGGDSPQTRNEPRSHSVVQHGKNTTKHRTSCKPRAGAAESQGVQNSMEGPQVAEHGARSDREGTPLQLAWSNPQTWPGMGKGRKGALQLLGPGHWRPGQSVAAASARVGHGHSKPQKESVGLHGNGKVQRHSPGGPMGSICLKSQGLDRHTQKQMLHASGTLPTRLSKAAGTPVQEGKAPGWIRGVGSLTCPRPGETPRNFPGEFS